MTKIIGLKQSKGNFTTEGKTIDYNNIMLYVITDADSSVLGMTASEIKIKVENFEKITGYKLESMPELLDKQVSLNYILIKNKPVLESIIVKK